MFDDEGNSSTVDVNIAAASGTILISQAHRLLGIDAASGQQLWSTVGNARCWSDATVPVTDGTYVVQVGVCGQELHAFLVATGTPIWDVNVDHFAARPVAAANGVLYTAPLKSSINQRIQAFSMDTGQLLQDIDVNFLVSELMVAGGTLYATSLIDSMLFGYQMGGSSDGYLAAWDNDGDPLTNPMAQSEIHLTQRVQGGQSSYGAEVQVGALIGTEPATLRVYRADGSIYKQTTAQPNRYGHGYWIVPVEYAAAGYQYDVTLHDGEQLARRAIRMPSRPSDNVRMVERLDGLHWESAPGTVSSFPARITLRLPNDFPGGPVDALLMLDAPARGSTHIAGQRDGNLVVFTLTRNNVVRGTFTMSAVARAGNVVVFSDERSITLQSASLPTFMAGQVTTVGHAPDGSVESVTYEFERDRPEPEDDATIEAEVAQIIPYGGGYHVVVHISTPSESDPAKALERPHRVQIVGRDAAGNPISQNQRALPPNLNQTPVTFELPRNSARPITQIEVSALEPDPTAEPDPQPQPPMPPPPPPPMCAEDFPSPGDPDEDEEDEDPQRSWRLRDLFRVSTTAGVGASGAYYIGAGGSASVSYDWIQREASACVAYGARGGMELKAGPSYSMNFGLNLRGPGHDAPASSGKKINITAAAGIGVDLSYTIPDNWQSAGFGTISLGFTAAPQAGASAGISQVHCDDLNNNPPLPENRRRKCCGGPCNEPPDLPPPPGNDHPDDTLSVVLFNPTQSAVERADRWATMARQARVVGYQELADYATYRMKLALFDLEIEAYPDDVALNELTAAQQALVADYLHTRIHEGHALQERWPTILSQWERLMAATTMVFAGGYYMESVAMLESYGIPTRLVAANFSPDAMSGLLVIPTGGLYGIADVEAFRARLARFVEQGGTLLVMSQPESNSLNALPGAAGLSQVGYTDDMACFQDAMIWRTYHPMLASLSSASVDAHVDGYLTGLPANAQLLLERTKNQQGAFAIYPYGDGQVIVTNLYEDWGRTVAQSSPEIRELFRDVVRWAADPADLPTTRPNGSVQVAVNLVNHSPNLTAQQVRYIVRDPNEAEVARLEPTGVNLPPDSSQSAAPTVSVPGGPLGIWWLNYELLDSDGQIVQAETLGSRFVVANPPDFSAATVAQSQSVDAPRAVAAQPPQGHATASLHQPAYAPGETVQVTLDIHLADVSQVGDQLRVMVAMGETTETRFVDSQANQQVSFALPADFSGNGLLFFGVYNEETGQSIVLDTIWVPAKGERVTVSADRFRYAPGEVVTLQVESNSARAVYFQGPGINREVQVPAGHSTVDFTLPSTMASGPFTVRYNDGATLRVFTFDVQGPQLKITQIHTAQTQVAAGTSVPGEVHVHSDRAVDVFLMGTLIEPDGYVAQLFVEEVSLVEGDQVLPVTIPFDVYTGGMIRFEVTIVDRANPQVEYVRAARTLGTNTPELLAARAVEITTAPGGETQLLLDWYSPAARTVNLTIYGHNGPIANRQVSVAQGFTTSEITLRLEGGSYDLVVVGEVDGLRTMATALVVVEPQQRLYLPRLQKAGAQQQIYLPGIPQ